MKIQADRKHLLDILGRAALVASKRSPKEVLTRVLIVASDGQAVAYATDTEVSIALTIKCDVAKDGKSLLPMKVMSALRECTEETVTIESSERSLSVSCGTAHLSFQVENPDEFPRPKFTDQEECTELSSEAFSQVIERTIYACDPDSSRFALGGVLFINEDDTLVAVGTDGRRLSRATAKTISYNVNGLGEQCVVPEHALKSIAKLSSDGTVKIWSDGSSFMLSGEGVRLSARMLEGRYPNWKQVIPDMTSFSKAEVTSGSLQRSLRQSAIVTDETRAVDMSFTRGDLSLSAAAADVGRSKVNIPIEYDGQDMAIKIDHRYVLDFLDSAETLTTLNFKESTSALVLTSGDFLNVIMPMSRDQ